MALGSAFGFSDAATVALAIGLAFLFGYALTSLPLLRFGLALAAVVPIALAADTVSIAIMEAIDNAFVLAVPGAMDASLGDALVLGSPARRLRAGIRTGILRQSRQHPAREGLSPWKPDATAPRHALTPTLGKACRRTLHALRPRSVLPHPLRRSGPSPHPGEDE